MSPVRVLSWALHVAAWGQVGFLQPARRWAALGSAACYKALQQVMALVALAGRPWLRLLHAAEHAVCLPLPACCAAALLLVIAAWRSEGPRLSPGLGCDCLAAATESPAGPRRSARHPALCRSQGRCRQHLHAALNAMSYKHGKQQVQDMSAKAYGSVLLEQRHNCEPRFWRLAISRWWSVRMAFLADAEVMGT